MKFFISSAIDAERLRSSLPTVLELGKANYSWKIVAEKYRLALQRAGYETSDVIRPEIYQSAIARQVAGISATDVHLTVKPIEHIRPMFGVANFNVAGWEFPELSTQAQRGNPFLNQVAVLRHASRILCWSEFTARNFRLHGLDQAIVLPPPVVLSTRGIRGELDDLPVLALDSSSGQGASNGLQPLRSLLAADPDPVVFLTVANPWDPRKQLREMLQAFLAAAQRNPRIRLIVKLVIDNVGTTIGNIQEILADHYKLRAASDKICFVGARLTDQQMASLIASADFYLCASSTEGLNIPLIESMSAGVVPLSSKASAMADYIDDSNAIVFDHQHKPTIGAYHHLHEFVQTTHFPPTMASMIDGISRAAEMSPQAYRLLSSRAVEKVTDLYAQPAFERRIANLIAEGRSR